MATNIQFLRSTTKGLRPDPTRLSLGTPMVNVHPDDPGLYFRLSNAVSYTHLTLRTILLV